MAANVVRLITIAPTIECDFDIVNKIGGISDEIFNYKRWKIRLLGGVCGALEYNLELEIGC